MRHVLIYGAIDSNVLLSNLAGAGQMPQDTCEAGCHDAGGADGNSLGQVADICCLTRLQLANLGTDNLGSIGSSCRGIGHNAGHVDSVEIRTLRQVHHCLHGKAQELAHVTAGNHLLKALVARTLGLCIQLVVPLARHQLVEAAGLHVDDSGRTVSSRSALHVAIVAAGSVDAANLGIRILIAGSQQLCHGVIDNSHNLDIFQSLPVEGSLQKVIDNLTLNARNRKLLGPDNQAGIVNIGLLGREREGMTEIVGLFLSTSQKLSKHISNKVKYLLSRGRTINQVIFLRHQWLCHHLDNLILAIALEAHQLSTEVGAAEIQCQELTFFLTVWHTDVGAKHWHACFLAPERQLHVKAQCTGNLIQLFLVQSQLLNNPFQLFLVNPHQTFPSLSWKNVPLA